MVSGYEATVPDAQISEEPVHPGTGRVDGRLVSHPASSSQKHKHSFSSLNLSGTLSFTRALGSLDHMLWLIPTFLPTWGPGQEGSLRARVELTLLHGCSGAQDTAASLTWLIGENLQG